ncbi:MAG TPA: trehalase-like domain-containing protein, partial [Kofleriaceae bacterium]|nr:trehalase-like domain-containing protein [Kofleriaceae bacterium]
MPPRIGDHAVIGDGRSAALVARDGTIAWLAWPRFDSDALFAAILDPEVGGSFRVAPAGLSASQRRYLPDSNVLETTFSTADGTMRVVDLMPVSTDAARLAPERELLRLVECTEGEVELDVLFDARPGFGARSPRVRQLPGIGLRFEDGRAA